MPRVADADSHSSSHIELAAAHKKMTPGIGADKTAFMIEELAAAYRTKLPPLFLIIFLFCRC
jgi:hypothetical protein